MGLGGGRGHGNRSAREIRNDSGWTGLLCRESRPVPCGMTQKPGHGLRTPRLRWECRRVRDYSFRGALADAGAGPDPRAGKGWSGPAFSTNRGGTGIRDDDLLPREHGLSRGDTNRPALPRPPREEETYPRGRCLQNRRSQTPPDRAIPPLRCGAIGVGTRRKRSKALC